MKHDNTKVEYKHTMYRFIKIVGWIGAIGCLLTACEANSAKRTASNRYEMLTVGLSDYTSENLYPATLRGKQFVSVRPQVSGLLTRICIEEGAKVKSGQLLFVIDQVPYRAALRNAEANVANAEAQVATAKMTLESKTALHGEGIVSDFDLQTAQNALASAQAALAIAEAQQVKARQDLSYTEVRSPVEGVTSMIPYRVGDLLTANASEPLVTVSDDQTIHAYLSMTERQVLDLTQRYGSTEALLAAMPEVGLRLSNGQRYNQNGKIDAISGTIDPETGAVQLRASFPNPEMLLRNGGSGQIVIPLRFEQAIVIPRAATFEMQDKVFCYRVVEGKTVQTPLQVTSSDEGQQYLVHEGLKVGDVIIAKGAGLVKNGMEVTAQ